MYIILISEEWGGIIAGFPRNLCLSMKELPERSTFICYWDVILFGHVSAYLLFNGLHGCFLKMNFPICFWLSFEISPCLDYIVCICIFKKNGFLFPITERQEHCFLRYTRNHAELHITTQYPTPISHPQVTEQQEGKKWHPHGGTLGISPDLSGRDHRDQGRHPRVTSHPSQTSPSPYPAPQIYQQR